MLTRFRIHFIGIAAAHIVTILFGHGDLWAVVLSTLSFVLVFLSYCKFGQFINPLSVYVTSWSITVLLFQLELLPFPGLETQTYTMVIASIITFAVGSLSTDTTSSRPETQRSPYEDRWSSAMNVVAILGIVAFAAQLFRSGTLNYMQLHDNLLFTEIPGPLGWAKAFAPGAILMVATAEATHITRLNKLLAAANLLILLAYPRRNLLFMALIALLFVLVKKGSGVVVTAVILIAFISVFVFSQTYLNKSVDDRWWTSPYLYATGNLYSFQVDLNMTTEYSYGARTFYVPILVASRLSGGIISRPAESPLNGEPVEDLWWFNTYPYLREVYRDFGWIGVLVIPAIFGYLTSVLQLKSTHRPMAPHASYLRAAVLSAIVLSVRQAAFADISWWVWLLSPAIGLGLISWVDRRYSHVTV